jgi:eukaryotic-like serine/threonine-protein kinase
VPQHFDLKTNDPTLDSPHQPIAKSGKRRCAHVALVEGSGPQISVETATLLRLRLQAAALSLLLACSAFFLYRLATGKLRGPQGDLLFGAQIALLVALGVSWLSLRRRCRIPNHFLRAHELLIFGSPALFMLLLERVRLGQCVELGYLPNPVSPWCLLIFTYALFIPNNWRRAAVVIGCMAAAPLILLLVLWSQHAICATLLDKNPGFLAEVSLTLGVAFATSVYGTHMMGTLRREAFEARQLGQYRLLELIGAGGMGEVYLAEHQMMKRPCAIKLIRPNKGGDPQALARFEREVQATAKLSHWNTVEIFDYGRADDGTFYYVMEYLPGLSLAQLVDQYGPLPPERLIYLLQQVCDALGEAHGANLIHRDIKPGNIFAAIRGGYYDVAKLLDFGLAKPMSEVDDVHLTQAGSITGSPLYMSPEQATGDSNPDARSDIYSLGAMAYFLLTGVPPFAGDQPLKVIIAHASQEVLPPSRLRAEVPADLEAVILRCMAKAPRDRYQTAANLSAALGRCAAAGRWGRKEAAQWWQTRESGTPAVRETEPVLL